MELEQFIEEDIRAFLDKKQAQRSATVQRVASPRPETTLTPEELPLYTPSRDYTKELDDALAAHDTPLARRILAALKYEFDQYPTDAPEKLAQKTLVESLTRRFQETLRHDPLLQEESLAEELKERFSKPVQQQPLTPLTTHPSIVAAALITPTKPIKKEQMPKPVPATPIKPPSGMSEAEERSFLADMQEAEMMLRTNDIKGAIRAYRSIRMRVAPEEMTPQQRDRILPRIHGLYDTISQRMIHLKETPEPASMPTKVQPATREVKKAEQQTAQQKETDTKRLYNEHRHVALFSVSTGDRTEAMIQYKEMRKLFITLPEQEQAEERTELKGLFDRIHSMPATPSSSAALLEHEERQLIGKP